ncbi:MAG TPA: AHH domain-containing protein, partial [Myxococcus sp.]|nr:AHH domain-containing protein [Myxococcus sp.]
GRPLEYVPAGGDASVEVGEDDFEEALARLVLEVPLTLRPSQAGWRVRAASHGATVDRTWQYALRGDHGRWCKAHEGPVDCLSLLEDGLGFDALDRLTLALGMAFDPMRESIADAVEETLNPQLFYAMVVTGMATWVALLGAPEPVVTKAAAVLAGVMVVYLGVGPFLQMAQASYVLKQAADRATTLEELEVAGERFGRVMGKQGARVFILALAMVLGRGTAGVGPGMAPRVAMLPRFSEASALGASQAGLNLGAVGEVSAVAVSAGTLTVTLAPTAVAMVAMGVGGDGIQGDPEGTVHHICTDKNAVSAAEGGPWTPLFDKFFRRAGMSLKNDPANQVRIRGHQGPHPQAYHEEVFRRVSFVMRRCTTEASCREALTRELRRMAQELTTPGSKLRQLLIKE